MDIEVFSVHTLLRNLDLVLRMSTQNKMITEVESECGHLVRVIRDVVMEGSYRDRSRSIQSVC